ncbi:MAG: hypothetical protein Q9160_001948 [Pyrenula sp. 1 TL-2023]
MFNVFELMDSFSGGKAEDSFRLPKYPRSRNSREEPRSNATSQESDTRLPSPNAASAIDEKPVEPTRLSQSPFRGSTSSQVDTRIETSPPEHASALTYTHVDNDTGYYGLRTISEPAHGLGTSVDIVFLHGFTGDSQSTWLDKKSGVYWPKDLLPEDIPTARVLSFGYEADVTKLFGPVSQNTLRNHAENFINDLADKRADANAVSPCWLVPPKIGALPRTDLYRSAHEALYSLLIASEA